MADKDNSNERASIIVKNDIILFVIIIALSLSIGLVIKKLSKKGEHVNIYVDGSLYMSVPIDKNNDYLVETDKGFNLIRVEESKVLVVDADCLDKICVNHNPIDSNNNSIICLPHKLVVEIE